MLFGDCELNPAQRLEKLLRSDGCLRIAAAGKNSRSGRQETESYEVEGPVMMFLTTTSERPDPELANRCLTLRVNESPEQTTAIQARQRLAYTLGGQLAHEQHRQRTALHQNAQRLLRPLAVVIPWAEQLQFRHDQTHMRRDHAKYLSASAVAGNSLRPPKTRRAPNSGGLRPLRPLPGARWASPGRWALRPTT